MDSYDDNKIQKLVERIRQVCLSESGIVNFPFHDFKLIMHPYEKHVNFRVIKAAVNAIVEETSIEVIPAITLIMNEIYDKYAIPEVKELMEDFDKDTIFDLSHKHYISDKKGPFKSQDIENETLWMSYESYQLYNWICESLSSDPNFVYNANLKGTERDMNVLRLMKTNMTPELTYKYGVPRFARNYNNTIYLTPLEVKPGRALYEFRVIKRFIPRSNNTNIKRGERITQGKLAYVPRMFGYESATINSIQMMGDGYDKGIYEILYEKNLFRKYWDMSFGFLWAATIGQRQIVEDQVAAVEDALYKYHDLNVNLEKRVSERTSIIEMQKTEIENANAELKKTLNSLKETQKILIQSEKMASLGKLVAGIAHEIQNPLNFVNNFSEVNSELLEELKKLITSNNSNLVNEITNDIIENEQKIQHHGQRAESIIKAMFQHCQADVGIKEPTDINSLCHKYLNLSYDGFKKMDKSFNVDFRFEEDKSLPKAEVIPQDIGRVILNICNNAFYVVLKKTNKKNINYKPEVVVSTKNIDGKIQIKIQDNGFGIPDNIMDKIFEPFFTTKPAGEGTGFGLSLSYDIIKAHGGYIEVNSKENKGSEFIIHLKSVQ